ncbi:hypothetical protein LTR84_001995 [Exophiala bonariae]|uniref:NAD(P)-binding domain-containing protein n=1 Tax=Exophiala bonariae TaxID=1690606 RepID=A0AAV9NC26_9EURO|nr:hypothetical protein LTR84_001995 [Exophiala bonariae]
MARARQPTLTVFGATGNCAAHALVAALKAGLNCITMVRTPAKLRHLLEDQHKIPSNTLDSNLVVVQGNIKSTEDVKRTLTTSGRLPDRILFAVGGSPIMQFSLVAPINLDDPHICEEGMKTLVTALRSCITNKIPLGPLGIRPVLITISTISMSSRRDLPYLYYPLEYWLVNIPRKDKKALEDVIWSTVLEDDSPFGDFAMVRPPLLRGGAALGPEKVRAGWVWPDQLRQEKIAQGEKEAGPAIGWSIAKADVGRWIFDNLIMGNDSSFGKCWTLTS